MSVIVHESFEDVVELDYDGSLDGDDSGDPNERRTMRGLMSSRGTLVQTKLVAKQGTIVVPYPTGVNEGDEHSDAVYAVKRAYARRKGRRRLKQLMDAPLEQRRRWGPAFSKEFGAKSYTKTRHQQLAPWFDDYALALLRSASKATARDIVIAKQLGWHNALYNRRFAVPYSQARPSQLVEATRVTRADCSGSIAGGCWWAGILKVVDWRYTNTWSQITFGHAVASVKDAIPGDVFLYGSPSHEALYLGNGLVWSFGSYPAKILPHDYRHDRCAIRRFFPLSH